MPCPLCGSLSGNVTAYNLGVWAAGAFGSDIHFENEPGYKAFAELEKFIKRRST